VGPRFQAVLKCKNRRPAVLRTKASFFVSNVNGGSSIVSVDDRMAELPRRRSDIQCEDSPDNAGSYSGIFVNRQTLFRECD